jgi:glycosyltransferase involved in cell wall biosynthesis
MTTPLISICIPTYERVEFLQRLLDSIKIQKFKSFEVIVTDDSKTDKVHAFIQNYSADFILHYYKNPVSLGTSKNMVEGKKYASGDWIKIIHDDDWFTDENSLYEYVNAIKEGNRFIFAGRNDYYEKNKKYVRQVITQSHFEKICATPFLLLATNPLGPPSTVMFHKSVTEYYDTELIWATDIEYYIRILLKEKATYIAKPLINMSYNDTQVTNYVFNNPVVRIPELFHLINRYGMKNIENIIVYDAWWRLFRNLNIRSQKDILKYAANVKIPLIIQNMVRHLGFIPQRALKNGFISKSAMTLSYLFNRSNADKS